jgi:hypothetical protein
MKSILTTARRTKARIVGSPSFLRMPWCLVGDAADADMMHDFAQTTMKKTNKPTVPNFSAETLATKHST